jgi:AcrR family transcriptional regulator
MSITEERKKQLEIQRRQQIQKAAMQLFFENGYRNTSMSDIAKDAGISKGLIYHYFKNKQELLSSFQDKIMDCLNEIGTLSTCKETLIEFGRRFLLIEKDEEGYIPPLQVLIVACIKGELDQDFQEGNTFLKMMAEEYFVELFKKGIEAGEFKQGDPLVYSNIFWNYLIGRLMTLLQVKDTSRVENDLKHIINVFE